MDFSLNKDQKELQKMARQFADGELAPFAAKWDEEKIFPLKTIKKAGELGLMGIYASDKIGGLNLSRLDASIIFEELATGCTSTTAYITIHNMVTWMVGSFATEKIKDLYGEELSAGKLLGSYCLTEPTCGSDAAALKSTAKLSGDYYIVNGSKAFVSGGGETDILIVMARTSDDGARGISALVIDSKSQGIKFGKNENKMGWNSQPTREISFSNVNVPKENLLGKEGEGFKIAMQGLDGGRINIGSCSIGAARKCLCLSASYLHQREAFGQPLANFQTLQFKIAEMSTKLISARTLIRLAATKLDSNDRHKTMYCAMAKKLATDAGFEICNESMQIFGGYGYIKEYPLERFQRDCRVHQILEGTNEIMNLIISRSILDNNNLQDLQ